jgi:hypothetical protein
MAHVLSVERYGGHHHGGLRDAMNAEILLHWCRAKNPFAIFAATATYVTCVYLEQLGASAIAQACAAWIWWRYCLQEAAGRWDRGEVTCTRHACEAENRHFR